MSCSVNRISTRNNYVESPALSTRSNAQGTQGATQENSLSFLDLIVKTSRDHTLATKAYTKEQHHKARLRVFTEAVNKVLISDQNHPYRAFALTPEGKAMREAIIEIMVNSHLHA